MIKYYVINNYLIMRGILSLSSDNFQRIFDSFSNTYLLGVSKKIKEKYINYITNITNNIYNINYINKSMNSQYNKINYILQYYFEKPNININKLYDLLLLLIINNGTTLIYICDYIIRYKFISQKINYKMINNIIAFSTLRCLNNSDNIKNNKRILKTLNITFIKQYIKPKTLLYNYFMTAKFNLIKYKYIKLLNNN